MDGDGPPKLPSQGLQLPKTSQKPNSSQQGSQQGRVLHSTPSPLLSQNALLQLMEMIPGNSGHNQSTFIPNYWSQLSFYSNSSIPMSQAVRLLQTPGSQPLPNLNQRLSQELANGCVNGPNVSQRLSQGPTSRASTTTVFNSQESPAKRNRPEEDATEEEIDVIGEPNVKRVKIVKGTGEKPASTKVSKPILQAIVQKPLQKPVEKPSPIDPSSVWPPFGHCFPPLPEDTEKSGEKPAEAKKKVTSEIPPFSLRPRPATPTPTPPPSTPLLQTLPSASSNIPPFSLRPKSFPLLPAPSAPTPPPPTPLLPTFPSASSHVIPIPGPGSPFSPLFGSVGLTRYPPPRMASHMIFNPSVPSQSTQPIHSIAGGHRVPIPRPPVPVIQVPVVPSPSIIQPQAAPCDASVKFRVFMEPQQKSSKNLDFVSGMKEADVDASYFVFAREQVAVPFHVFVHSSCSSVAKKIKIKVVYKGTETAVPQCANHQEVHRDLLQPEQLVQFVTPLDLPDVDYLPYSGDGGGFVVNSTPPKISLVFHCRNSCNTRGSKEFCLQFSLLDEKSESIATREMSLKVVQIPLRDIRKEGIEYEVVPEITGGITFRPFGKDDPRLCKSVKLEPSLGMKREEQPLEDEENCTSSQLHTIYVHGDESYARLMRYVKMEETRKRSTAAWSPLVPKLNSWTNETPIQELLTHACGPIQADPLLELFEAANIENLGEMAEKFDSHLLSSLGIKPSLASTITSLFLNWYNFKRCDEL